MAISIVCICADWCDTCNAFRAIFDEVERSSAEHSFCWQSLEDLEEIFPAIEVETFPTILLVDERSLPIFVTPILPNRQALMQLVKLATDRSPLGNQSELALWIPVAEHFGWLRKSAPQSD